MASAWGSAWGSSWGNSWGAIVAATRPRGWDDASGEARRRRRPVYVYYEEEPEPVALPEQPKRRTITRKAVAAAVEDVSWVGNWSVAEAMGALPKSVPLAFVPPPDMPAFDITVIAAAMWLRDEMLRRQEDEDEIELLLMAA